MGIFNRLKEHSERINDYFVAAVKARLFEGDESAALASDLQTKAGAARIPAKEDDFIGTAGGLLEQGRLSEARKVLERGISKQPPSWTPILDAGDMEIIFSWSQREFLAYVEHRRRSGLDRDIEWQVGSFSHAFFLLGWIKLEMGEVLPALYSIERGIALEPDHPRLLCEKGHILQRMQRHDEALRFFQRAETARPWAPVAQIAAALRGQGINLIDLGRLGDARNVLLKSLELEPENDSARDELQYISDSLAELNQRSGATALGDDNTPFRQYTICTCPANGTFIEPDSLMRFHTARAAVERLIHMRPQELTVVVRVDMLGQFVGKNLNEAALFGKERWSEFAKWLEG